MLSDQRPWAGAEPPSPGWGCRRRDPRLPLHYLAAYTARRGEIAIELVGRTRDVSASGLQLETFRKLQEGEILDLDIAVGRRRVRARGKVIHVRQNGERSFANGVEFTAIEPSDRRRLLARRR